MFHAGRISHIVSFNWDDLTERAYVEGFGVRIPKITRDGVTVDRPNLWKLHGDVEDLNDQWIFPYEVGKVFDTLIKSFEEVLGGEEPPEYGLIVGYSEWEPEVKLRLINWLERYVPKVLRIRPNWPEHNENGIRDSAKRFFQRLKIYMQIEERGRS